MIDELSLPPDAETERVDRTPMTPGHAPDTERVRSPPRPLQTPQANAPQGLPARYTGRDAIGRGGMGEVLRAQDERLRRDVAIKRAHNQTDAETQARFVAEAQIGGQLDHPGVLPVYDFGRDAEGHAYFAMKLVEHHRTLADIITALKAGDPDAVNAFSFQRRVALIQQVCRTVSYAHERGVVHRDLKPANVVVGTYGEVYVVDWGIAQIGDAPRSPVDVSPEVREVLNRYDAEAIMGTPAYMSPEYLNGTGSSPACDVWSLTAMLYELLTLHHPFGDAHTPRAMATAYDALPPAAAEGFRDETYGRVPRSLSQVLKKGFDPDQSRRWQSARDLEHALQTWLEGASPIVCPGTWMQRVLARMGYIIDQRPVLVPMLILAVATVTLASGVAAAIMLAMG